MAFWTVRARAIDSSGTRHVKLHGIEGKCSFFGSSDWLHWGGQRRIAEEGTTDVAFSGPVRFCARLLAGADSCRHGGEPVFSAARSAVLHPPGWGFFHAMGDAVLRGPEHRFLLAVGVAVLCGAERAVLHSAADPVLCAAKQLVIRPPGSPAPGDTIPRTGHNRPAYRRRDARAARRRPGCGGRARARAVVPASRLIRAVPAAVSPT